MARVKYDTVLTRQLMVDGKAYDYTLTFKRVRNINMRVRRDGTIAVSASPQLPIEYVERFVQSKGKWLKKATETAAKRMRQDNGSLHLLQGEQVQYLGKAYDLILEEGSPLVQFKTDGLLLRLPDPQDEAARRRLFDRWVDKRCEEVFVDLEKEVYPLFEPFGIQRPIFAFRRMQARWGSCYPKRGEIILNKKLIEFSPNCIKSVLVHEYAHLKVPNHGKDFYKLVSHVMPNYAMLTAQLNGWEM